MRVSSKGKTPLCGSGDSGSIPLSRTIAKPRKVSKKTLKIIEETMETYRPAFERLAKK